MPSRPLNTAVLLIIFNRIEVVKQVFEQIRQAKPPRLYIAADGPRKGVQDENKIVKEVRDYIIDHINWDCEVKTLFREKNLGCKYAVSGAIDWFFENEEMGIILEEDCLPSKSFFWFCENLLEKYQDDMRVWHIGGYKFPYMKGDSYSYTFTRYTHIWGWASWASRWKYNDVEISKYKKNRNIVTNYEYFRGKYENSSRINILDRVLSGETITWDYQWNFAVRINSGLSIRPTENLVMNIGFGEGAVHTIDRNEDIENNSAVDINFPLRHPELTMIYKNDDELYEKYNFDTRYVSKIKRKLVK